MQEDPPVAYCDISRYFLLTALAALLAGSLLGLWMALGMAGALSLSLWPELLRAHATLQVHGFVVVLTLGVALLVLPKFLAVPLAQPRVALLSWAALAAAVALGALGLLEPLARSLQIAGVIGFLVVLRRTRAGAPFPDYEPAERTLNRLHAAYMAFGVIWLLIALVHSGQAAADLILWGFATMYVAGIGLRVHPQILGLRVFHTGALAGSVIAWNVGLGLELAGFASGHLLTLAGIALYLVGLHPFRRARMAICDPPWLRLYLRISYGWLVLALLGSTSLTVFGDSPFGAAARHLLASGFLLSMIFGMAFRLIPMLEARPLVWQASPWVVLALLTVGHGLRVGGQLGGTLPLFALGGGLQVLACLTFSLTLGLTLLRAPSQQPPALSVWAA